MFALKTVKKGEKSQKRNEKYSDGFTAKITCGFSSWLQLQTTIIIRRTLSTLKAHLHIHILVVVLFYPSEVTGFTIKFHIFCCSSVLSASGLVPLEYRCMFSCEVHILWTDRNTNCNKHKLFIFTWATSVSSIIGILKYWKLGSSGSVVLIILWSGLCSRFLSQNLYLMYFRAVHVWLSPSHPVIQPAY